jgi:hypothetical protein
MSKYFQIKKGKFDIPKFGKVDTTKTELSDERALELFKVNRKVFPWILLKPDADKFLKKQNLNAEDVARMILNASNEEEVEILKKLSDAKKVATVAETKLNGFKNS